jgi:hypothetical protein
MEQEEKMGDSKQQTTFRIAWEHNGSKAEVVAVTNVDDQTITLRLPDGAQATLDVVTSRAVQMLLNHVTYCVLDPTGPPSFEVQAQGPRGAWHSVLRSGPTHG